MNKDKRYLIATADELTWKHDRPVVFLGDWCRLYDRKHVWQDMDSIVLPPYGIGLAKKDADRAEAHALKEKLFPVLCAILNQYHGTQHGDRFWRIMLGHWLRRYVDVMLNRVRTLEQCFLAHQISGFTAYSSDQYSLAATDSYSAIWAVNDDRWNNVLTKRILNLLGVPSFPVEVLPKDAEADAIKGFRFKAPSSTGSSNKSILTWGYQQASKVARYFVKSQDAFILSTYLPYREVIKLALSLGQCPQNWSSPKLDVMKIAGSALREELAKQIVIESENVLDSIVSKMLFELLPVCYLEEFRNLIELVEQQPWPESPKFIWTSNAFDTDEVFKLWTATKIETGSKYFVGQHGNNYGTYRYMWPSIEELTADKFLTWGWTDGLPQHTPAFLLKTGGARVGNFNPKGGLLLVELCLTHRITTWDSTSEFGEYFEDQIGFITGLNSTPRQLVTIRLHGGYKYVQWNDEARWQEFDPSLRIDTCCAAIGSEIANSRLVVHSYDSTGILETLSQNIPTLAFWQNGLDHLRESAKPYYQLLVDAEIVHFTPESIARKVNAVWDDVDGWWSQTHVQAARMKFCEQYARASQDPVRDIKNILLENI